MTESFKADVRGWLIRTQSTFWFQCPEDENYCIAMCFDVAWPTWELLQDSNFHFHC